MKSWISAERAAVWRTTSVMVVESGIPRRIFSRMEPSNKDGSWATRDRVLRYWLNGMSLMSLPW
jgi:hypothetical protein